MRPWRSQHSCLEIRCWCQMKNILTKKSSSFAKSGYVYVFARYRAKLSSGIPPKIGISSSDGLDITREHDGVVLEKFGSHRHYQNSPRRFITGLLLGSEQGASSGKNCHSDEDFHQ